MRKRIACFHDLASFGGAALMNIIPVMYSEGIEVCPIPTALFTSHGALKGSKSMGINGFIGEYSKQYKELNLSFDGIYLGLFTSLEQIKQVQDFLDIFIKEDTWLLLDPIMGDNGKLYSFINKENIKGMKELVKSAGIITPNLTEASILLGREFNDKTEDKEIEEILFSLGRLGPEYVVITSVPKEKYLCTYIYDRIKNKTDVVKSIKRPGSYPGTGDAFAAMLMADMLKGADIVSGVKKAAGLIEKGIDLAVEKGYEPLEGLPLAELL